MRKPYQSPGSDEKLIPILTPVGDRTHDLPHTVASNMVKVSHALNHSATEAVYCSFLLPISSLCFHFPCFELDRLLTWDY